jgi:putative flippase GtrA
VIWTKPGIRTALRWWLRLGQIVREALKFLAVGSLGYVTDVGIFNILMFAGGEGPLNDKPLTAKTISMVSATVVTYAGNRLWTFRHRERSGVAREYTLFFLLNGVGLLIGLACLGTSRYVLHLDGPVADNISANVIGVGLASLFRFVTYRRWVFREIRGELAASDPHGTVAEIPESHSSPSPRG